MNHHVYRVPKEDSGLALTTTQERNATRAEALVDLWQDRLGLSEWSLNCIFVHDTVMHDEQYVTMDLGPHERFAVLSMAVE